MVGRTKGVSKKTQIDYQKTYSVFLNTEMPTGYKGSENTELGVSDGIRMDMRFSDVDRSRSSTSLLYLNVFVSWITTTVFFFRKG